MLLSYNVNQEIYGGRCFLNHIRQKETEVTFYEVLRYFFFIVLPQAKLSQRLLVPSTPVNYLFQPLNYQFAVMLLLFLSFYNYFQGQCGSKVLIANYVSVSKVLTANC